MYECSGNGEGILAIVKPIKWLGRYVLESAGLISKRPVISAESKVEDAPQVEQSILEVVEKSNPTTKRSSSGGSTWFGNL